MENGNYTENPEKITGKSSENSETILAHTGVSYSQIPRNLFKLSEVKKLTASDVLLALKMFDWCHTKRKFPKFSISHSDLAKVTSLSRRQVMYGIERLNDVGLFIVRNEAGSENEYQWNLYFLQTGQLTRAESAHPPVQNLHTSCAKSAHPPVQNLHHIYIEFILDYLYILYKQYFTAQEFIKKRVPPKRGQKGVAKDFATHYFVSRQEEWKAAIEAATKKGGYARTYLALAGGFDIDNVAYPRSYLCKLIWDESHQWEAKKKSHLFNNGHLDTDDKFLNWILERSQRGQGEDLEAEFDADVEVTYMDSYEGEEFHE